MLLQISHYAYENRHCWIFRHGSFSLSISSSKYNYWVEEGIFCSFDIKKFDNFLPLYTFPISGSVLSFANREISEWIGILCPGQALWRCLWPGSLGPAFCDRGWTMQGPEVPRQRLDSHQQSADRSSKPAQTCPAHDAFPIASLLSWLSFFLLQWVPSVWASSLLRVR